MMCEEENNITLKPVFLFKFLCLPEHLGTTMCEGKMNSAMKSSGSGTFTGTSRIIHLKDVKEINIVFAKRQAIISKRKKHVSRHLEQLTKIIIHD